MAKRRISAKGVISDLRSGMDNAALMKKYRLSPSGLQSVYDKLLSSGAIDLSEVRDRMPGKWGTIPIREETVLRLINVQEAARDIRSGLDDGSMMRKHRLSFKGLQDLFGKLVDMGAIRQLDIDERRFNSLDRVSLDDDTVDLSTVIDQMFGSHSEESQDMQAAGIAPSEVPEDPEEIPSGALPRNGEKVPVGAAREAVSGPGRSRKGGHQEKRDPAPSQSPWYENPLIVALLLIVFFPGGFYALFRNRALSSRIKGCVVAGWVLLAAVSLRLLVALT